MEGKFGRIVFNTIIGFLSIIGGAWFLDENPLLSIAMFIIGIDGFKDAYNIYMGIKPSGVYNLFNILLETGSFLMSIYILYVSVKMVVYYSLPAYILLAFFTLMSGITSINELRQSEFSLIGSMKSIDVDLMVEESKYVE